jgi:hypothetical protein
MNEENLDELLSLGLDSIADNTEIQLEAPVEENIDETVPQEEVIESSDEVVEEAPTPKYVAKRKGLEVPLYSDEEVQTMINQSLDYTVKTQQLSKYRKSIESMESNGINDEDLVLLGKIKAGDKDAISFLTKKVGLDPMDLIDYDTKYVEVQAEQAFKPSDAVLKYDSIIRDNEPEVYVKLSEALSSMPQATLHEIASNDTLYSALYDDVKSGAYDMVNRELQREMLTRMNPIERARLEMNPTAFLTKYSEVAERIFNQGNNVGSKQVQQQPQEEAVQQPQRVQQKASVNKVAVQSGVRARETRGEVDIWNTPNEELERIMGRLPLSSLS